jgi:signal transduction histidine kinase
MKLVDKFTVWFVGVTFLLTPVTMYTCYSNLEKKIDDAEATRLKDVNELAARQLKEGIPLQMQTQGSSTQVTLLKTALPENKTQINKTTRFNQELKRQESLLRVNSYYTIGNAHYLVSSFSYVPDSKLILHTLLDTTLWKLLLIVILTGVTARLVSRKVLHSLKQTMDTIQHFNLKQKILFPAAGTREFKELNSFLQMMTDKAVDEYASVKEFSENASHELQTPLAILRNKLELLTETNIEEGQAALISDMQNAIDRLSRINRSLILLTKLENREYPVTEEIKICKTVKDVLAAYEDRIEMKNLSVFTEIDKNVFLKIHPALSDMLMNNLIGNAVRHNIQNGSISVSLTSRALIISNTGLPPEIPTEELFQRFKKSNQCNESIGLGLSIVRQICELNGFPVSYHYGNQLHRIQVDFQTKSREEILTLRQEGFGRTEGLLLQ